MFEIRISKTSCYGVSAGRCAFHNIGITGSFRHSDIFSVSGGTNCLSGFNRFQSLAKRNAGINH